MKFHKTPMAFAAFALCAGIPFAAHGAPKVTIKTPVNGQVLSGKINGANCATDATSSTGVNRVTFWANSWQINNDYSSPFNCDFDTKRLKDGPYTFKAVAYDKNGSSTTKTISIKVNNTNPPATTTPTTTTPTTTTPTTTTPTTTTPTTTTPTTTTLPAPTSGTLEVWFKAPLKGATVSGTLSREKCYVAGRGASRVEFFLDSTRLNTDTAMADGMSCELDTTKFGNGSHTLKAVAYNSSGASYNELITINVQNASITPPPATTPPPTTTTPTATLPAPTSGTLEVWFKSPLKGTTVSGKLENEKCYVAGRGVTRVEFFLDTTRLNTDSTMADGMSCVLDTTSYANGTHTLKAVAYNSSGASYNELITINVQNAATTPPPTTTTPPPTTTTPPPTTTTPPPTTTTPPPATSSPTLPSTNTKAVATFESLGLYWKPGSQPSDGSCNVRYRKQGESSWNEGFPMWYDTRDGECRGSLVHLTPGTDYEVQFSLPGQQPVAQVNSKTWSESFPIAQTVHVTDMSQPLNITQGGSANGYVLYTPAPGTSATIDVADAHNFNVTVSAPYVIVRGLTLKGAKQDGISLQNGARDVVIENNDISGWGRYRTTNSAGWKLGMDMDAGVRAACKNFSTPLERVVIQRNRIHDPRYGANSWSWGHPAGPQGITFSYCGGNHVFRYNEIYSGDKTRYFNDGIGGEDNFATTGFPVADTDIYGNKISNTWDDAIEAEGGNKNVRIWGNYIDQTSIGIASTVVHHGPLYIFRNVYNRSRHFSEKALDSDERNTFLKAGTTSSYGNGRRYVFHNTTLQATAPGVTNPLGAGHGLKGNTGQPLTNTVSRNNIFHVWKSGWASIMENGGSGNNLDYDLRNGGLSAYGGAEPNGTVGFPQYAPGHGWQSESGGQYQLAPTSPGYDRGIRLPNFNDGFTGAGPDAGAHEAGTTAMPFGVGASGPTPGTAGGAPVGGTTTTGTTTDGSTSTTGTTTTTTSSGGVCSTVWCAATQ